MDPKTRVAVVGATGAVGRELVGALEAAGHPAENVTLLASERSESEELPFGEDTLEVEKATAESFRSIQVALFATPADVSRTLAAAAQSAGAWAVDLSAAFRGDATVPLVLPGHNPDVVRSAFKGRIVRCPSPLAAAVVGAVEPLRSALGVREVTATALLGASSAGRRGVAELEKQSADLLSGRDPEAQVFPHRIAFNIIPAAGPLSAAGESQEEEALVADTELLWKGFGEPPLVAGTTLLVPTFFGHVLSLNVRLRAGATVERVREVLKGGKGLKLLDSPAEKVYPMPMLVTADDAIHVGRVRAQRGALDGFQLIVAIDNAGRGAALNALETASLLSVRAH